MISVPRTSEARFLYFNRPNIVSGVFFIAFLNGVSEIVFRSILTNGFFEALGGTFGISVIVFAGLMLGLQNLSTEAESIIRPREMKLLAIAICLILVPNPYFSWIAITLLAVYERRNSPFGSPRRRGAAFMLGVTIPMFWGKVLFGLFSGWILKGDALLVSTITHTSVSGNMVALPHQSGFLVIAPACSSFANVSLAVLCWLMFAEYSGRPRTFDDYVTCLSACVNVVLVNVARISIIGMRPDLYNLIHGPVGSTIASWITAIVVLATCHYGVKRAPVVGCGSDHVLLLGNPSASSKGQGLSVTGSSR